MQFSQYSSQAITTLLTSHGMDGMEPALVSQVFGLVGESGEVAEKFKKLIRDKNGNIDEADRQEILKELGDILWYINSVSHLLGSSLEEVADKNLKKVLSRKERGVTQGSGDNR
jgi:NTP pyrophosphatase (non-canonical NTP hydrolase)